MKIAAAQIACTLGDVAANVAKISEFAARASRSGAGLVLFPEMADTGYSMEQIRRHASAWDDGPVPSLCALAQKLAIAIICGVSERVSAHIYNAQVVIDRRGEIVAKYRKTHLFTPIEEHTCFAAGAELVSCPIGNLQIGLSICYDLRFPEVYRSLACDHSANFLAISSAWPFPRVEHLRVLARARAIENQSYVVLANRVGTDAGVSFCGSSAIVDPSGNVVASSSADREELIYGEVSGETLQSIRNRMPVFADRRPELYAGSIGG
ncbi:MAG: hypothetical protein H0X73_00720 [Chthoniobacterales bacterium]|nr:hypothetical protein [Chthoniobacterales bacterium]